MKITSRGRVTIPRDIREKSGMLPGSEVEVIMEDGRVLLRRGSGKGRSKARGKRVLKRGNLRMITDEILRLFLGEP